MCRTCKKTRASTLGSPLVFDGGRLLKAVPDLGANILSPIPKPSGNSRATRNRVSPIGRFPWEKPIYFNTRDIHRELRRYTDPTEKKIARWLYSTWNAEKESIKFQELQNAVRDGELPLTWRKQWNDDYSKFINDVLDPDWREGIEDGADYMTARMSDSLGVSWQFPETTARIESWINNRGGELAVNLSQEQSRAVRNVLRRSIADEALSPTELGIRLRPVIGLTEFEATAVENRRVALLDLVERNELAVTRVDPLTNKYSDFLLRRRATRIARTETAVAFNFGAFEGVRQARDEGLLPGTVVKRFSTSADERVCPFCGPLDGQIIGLEETFPGLTSTLPNTFVPPVHPNCRCTVEYGVTDPNGVVSVPFPRGVDPITSDNVSRLSDELQSVASVAELADPLSGAGQTSRALETVNSQLTFSGSNPRGFFVTDTRGRIAGATSWKTTVGQSNELLALGSLKSGGQVGTNLFDQFMRDASGHGIGATVNMPEGSKPFFTRGLGLPNPGRDNNLIIMSNRDVSKWIEKRGVRREGPSFNRTQ